MRPLAPVGVPLALAVILTVSAGSLSAQTAASGSLKKPPPVASSHAPAAPAPAPAADTTARLSGAIGVAVDSIHGGPLAGAVVMVSGTSRQAVSDSLGRFRIDSVPPGSYEIGMFHPMLDSLGMSITTRPVSFPPGRYAVVRLATPSAPAVMNIFCPADKRLTGPAVLVGRVLDADTDAPAAGARVSLTWSQLEVGRAIGIRHISRVRAATVDSGGSYQICGLPDNVGGVLRATRGGVGTAAVPLHFSPGQLVGMASLSLPSADPTPAAPDTTHHAADTSKHVVVAAAAPAAHVTGLRHGHAVVQGRILDPAGKPVVGAEVSVLGAEPTAATNDSGTFSLGGVPSGTQQLDVRKVGYAQLSTPVELSIHAPRIVTLAMHQAPPQLAKVNIQVSKMEKGLAEVGFTRRHKSGLGHYLTEDEIQEKQPQLMSDIFATMPGLHLDYSSGQPVIESGRSAGGGCVNYYIDNVPYKEASPGDINDYMRPDEVSAVEVYNSVDAPGEFSSAGNSGCQVIVVWTKTKIGG